MPVDFQALGLITVIIAQLNSMFLLSPNFNLTVILQTFGVSRFKKNVNFETLWLVVFLISNSNAKHDNTDSTAVGNGGDPAAFFLLPSYDLV